PKLGRIGIRIGRPLDFQRYEGMSEDRFVLRSMTDEIMYGLMALSGQEYVDIYAQRAKADLVAARAAAADAARAAEESAGGSVDAPAVDDRATETPQANPARWSRLARRARRARIRRPGRGRTPL
ncbi:MAG: 1-acyl-sn-glycerol-3-phosphate acyltransferase, partial [Frankia sp.]